jgi:glycosyltransferase involved in cell wall biosynthesis
VPSPARPTIDVVIPALDEERSLPRVLADLPRDRLRRIVVVDNGSSDTTAERAREAGANVVTEPRRGYGSACLAGLDRVRRDPAGPPDVVVFLDADYSDRPDELPTVVAPILEGRADLVIGSRTLGAREPGALLPQARFGNALATGMIRLLYGVRFTDLGPFRAVRWGALERLAMQDRDFGWTVEMQVKAARLGIPTAEVPVSYRCRIGTSKITGTIAGSVRAGWKILFTIGKWVVRTPRSGGSGGDPDR